jgi:hypothetical protein
MRALRELTFQVAIRTAGRLSASGYSTRRMPVMFSWTLHTKV